MTSIIAALMLIIELSWDNPSDDSIRGYKFYSTTKKGSYSNTFPIDIPVSNVSAAPNNRLVVSIPDFQGSTTRYGRLTAYNIVGESKPSKEITVWKVPSQPVNFGQVNK